MLISYWNCLPNWLASLVKYYFM